MEEFHLRRSNRIANIRDSTGSSGDRPLPMAISNRAPKKRMTIEDKDGDSKSIAVNESQSQSQSPPQTKTKKKKKKDGRVRAPRPRRSPYDYNLTQTEIRQHCALALAMFNKNNTDGPRYVLVRALNCYLTTFPRLYHCNFIARPKYSSSAAENRLFFGESKYVGHVSKPRILTCTVSCILGDVGIETGLQGCKFCKCEHPIGIEFRKSHSEAVDLAELTGFHFHQNKWI